MMASSGKLVSVNVGRPRAFDFNGHPATSAIWKTPVTGRVIAHGVNLEGDDQADRQVHGGPDKAIYAYAVEDIRWWEQELGRPLSWGEFGENLTTEGVDASHAVIGERWEVGTALLEVSQPRVPCWKLGVRMSDPLFPRRFAHALRPGAYLRIVREGDVGVGDEIRIAERPDHNFTVFEVSRIYFDDRQRESLERLAAIPQLSESWKEWAKNMLERSAP